MTVMSADEVAALAGRHVQTVRRDLRTGRLRARRFGRTYLIEAADARRYAAVIAREPGRPRKPSVYVNPSPELSRRAP